MALGRIDHLQHHFANAKFLNGQRSQDVSGLKSNQTRLSSSPTNNARDAYSSSLSLLTEKQDEDEHEDEDEMANFNPALVPLPPSPIKRVYVGSVSKDIDPKALRKTLETDLKTCARQLSEYTMNSASTDESATAADEEAALKVANNLTSCIRSARTYSTSIPSFQTLDLSFAVFRDDALELLSFIKRIVEREGTNGLSVEEKSVMSEWLQNTSDYLDNENPKVIGEAMNWINPELWQDKQEERYCHFLNFYDAGATVPTQFMGQDFLKGMSTGVRLCQIYNAVVQRSRRPFGLITRFHQDTSIRYRVLENLRFWHAAVEYRLGLRIEAFTPSEVYEFTETGQAQLSQAITRFCQVAIQEMIETSDEDVQDDDLAEDVDTLQIKEI